MAGDVPFDQQGERDNPWWGDPSYRRLPSDASAEDVRFYHLHVDASDAQKDLNCLLPLRRLGELAEAAEVGKVALRHYSIMGYNPQPHVLLEETVPQIVADLSDDRVDALLLFPA